MQRKLVIWGAAGHALVVADIIRLRAEYELVGFLDDVNPERVGTGFCGARILGGQAELDRLLDRGVDTLILGFGNSMARVACGALARAKGFDLATAIHPRATVAADVPVGAGTVIKAGAAIDPGVTVGEHVIVASCVCVGHGSRLEDGARLSSGASLAGNTTIGRGTMVGTGATIRNGVRVGANSLIGAGSTVVRDIPDGVVAYGTPARVMRAVTADDDH